jgi:hypothetical protein
MATQPQELQPSWPTRRLIARHMTVLLPACQCWRSLILARMHQTFDGLYHTHVAPTTPGPKSNSACQRAQTARVPRRPASGRFSSLPAAPSPFPACNRLGAQLPADYTGCPLPLDLLLDASDWARRSPARRGLVSLLPIQPGRLGGFHPHKPGGPSHLHRVTPWSPAAPCGRCGRWPAGSWQVTSSRSGCLLLHCSFVSKLTVLATNSFLTRLAIANQNARHVCKLPA